jgi:hypothetical protein
MSVLYALIALLKFHINRPIHRSIDLSVDPGLMSQMITFPCLE